MSEIAIQDVLAEAGRGDVSTNFWDSRRYEIDAVKQGEREKVAEFILRVAKGFPEVHRTIQLLSLPGIGWMFENYLRSLTSCQVVGLERSKTLYYQSRCFIPGVPLAAASIRHRLIEKSLPFGSGRITYSRVRCVNWGSQRYTSFNFKENRRVRSNRLLMMDAATYMNLFFDGYGATEKQREEFATRFYQRTAVWLDFTSQLCDSVEATVSKLPYCLDSSDFEKPVAITLMNARDRYHSADERVARLIKLQPLLKPVKHWTYVGKGGVSMLTACFLVR